MRKVTALGAGLLLAAIGTGRTAPAVEPGSEPSAANARSMSVEAGGPLADLVLIAPGTQVDRTLPKGWSNLVVKSVPRLVSGDLKTLPEMASTTATLFRTVLLADVRPVGGRYTLRRVGLGLCTPIQGHDTVVRSDSLKAQGIDLGLVGRTVLDRAEQELLRGRLVARTPTFALFSAPAVMRFGPTHREVLLRYALLVDPATGELRTLVWYIAPDPSSRAAAQSMVLLTPGVVYNCGLDVAAEQIFGALPVSWSFAIRSLPPGQARAVPADLQPWSVREAPTPLEAGQFEEVLRRALVEPLRSASR